MFHDEVRLIIESGKGGDGSTSFRREKYIPRGGPDGGDGGRGGDVFIVATRQLSDLNQYASVRHLAAEAGVDGGGQKLFGRAGEDLTISLPIGTRVFRKLDSDWRLVVDLTRENDPFRLLSGGTGGRGNVHFATAVNQAPHFAEPGEPSQRGEFKFELQLIADAGIIGLPNAGKSTFLSVVSEAKPKVADYPFTTLSPVLGVATVYDKRFVLADIPGLIEGAAEGKGLGHRFLRHIKRTKVLIHLIDAVSTDYARDYRTVRTELDAFDPSLITKPEIVVISKSELVDSLDQTRITKLQEALGPSSHLFNQISISAVTRVNVDSLMHEVAKLVGLTIQ